MEWLTHRKEIRELNAELVDVREQLLRAEAKIEKYKHDIEEFLKDRVQLQKDEKDSSSIIFYISDNLEVSTVTKVSKGLTKAMVKAKRIDSNAKDDPTANHIALMTIAADVSNQILEEYEGELVDEDGETVNED